MTDNEKLIFLGKQFLREKLISRKQKAIDRLLLNTMRRNPHLTGREVFDSVMTDENTAVTDEEVMAELRNINSIVYKAIG